MAIVPLTLIVATTPSLGLGFRGALPWPPLKADLAFFARVTKRAPTQCSSLIPHLPMRNAIQGNQTTTINAVIMGRKTWESIPMKFRPLKERINVVVSRQAGDSTAEVDGKSAQVVMRVQSVEEGLERLQRRDWTPKQDLSSQSHESQPEVSLGRVFVIGGAEIYNTVLKMECCERVLWTRIDREWDCDVWFPEGVFEEGENCIWERKEEAEMNRWCGEAGIGERREEAGIGFRIEMWERRKIGQAK